MWPRFAFTVVLGALGLSGALSGVRLAHAPEAADLDAAATAVRARFRPGDVVVSSPWTLVETRRRLGDLPLLEPKHPHPDDLAGRSRAHLVELGAVGGGGDARRVLAAAGRAGAAERFGRVTLTTFDLHEPTATRFDLWRDLHRVEVLARYADGGEHACGRWDRDRWVCPRDGQWSYVGRQVLDIGDDPRACVWLHPLAKGGRLRVVLPPALPGIEPAELVGGFGLTEHAARSARAPVRVRITAAGGPLLERVHPVGAGWSRYRLGLAPGTGGLAVEVESDDNGAAHFCFALRIVGGR